MSDAIGTLPAQGYCETTNTFINARLSTIGHASVRGSLSENYLIICISDASLD